jgi:hypothetical protein
MTEPMTRSLQVGEVVTGRCVRWQHQGTYAQSPWCSGATYLRSGKRTLTVQRHLFEQLIYVRLAEFRHRSNPSHILPRVIERRHEDHRRVRQLGTAQLGRPEREPIRARHEIEQDEAGMFLPRHGQGLLAIGRSGNRVALRPQKANQKATAVGVVDDDQDRPSVAGHSSRDAARRLPANAVEPA